MVTAYNKRVGIQHNRVIVYCDNQRALHLAKHKMLHVRSKHIDVKLHLVRDVVEKGNNSSFEDFNRFNLVNLCAGSFLVIKMKNMKFSFLVDVSN